MFVGPRQTFLSFVFIFTPHSVPPCTTLSIQVEQSV